MELADAWQPFPTYLPMLRAAVAAVQGRVPIYVDGGIRRGTDVLKVGGWQLLVCQHASAWMS